MPHRLVGNPNLNLHLPDLILGGEVNPKEKAKFQWKKPRWCNAQDAATSVELVVQSSAGARKTVTVRWHWLIEVWCYWLIGWLVGWLVGWLIAFFFSKVR